MGDALTLTNLINDTGYTSLGMHTINNHQHKDSSP